jgi:hypothetical protein
MTPKTVHLCVDMQRIFSHEGPWSAPWMDRVLPKIVRLAKEFPERTPIAPGPLINIVRHDYHWTIVRLGATNLLLALLNTR